MMEDRLAEAAAGQARRRAGAWHYGQGSDMYDAIQLPQP